MFQPRPQISKRFWHQPAASIRQFPGLSGCITAFLIAVSGRSFLSVTTSTLSGWTALFFFSLFNGLIVAFYLSTGWRISKFQWALMCLGSASSLVAIASYQASYSNTADATLVISGMLLLASLLGTKRQGPTVAHAQNKLPAQWVIGLDDLLKYELTQEVRTAIVTLIDGLWSASYQRTDFIPAQSQQFEDLLGVLESSIRQNQTEEAKQALVLMTQRSNELRDLLSHGMKIEYQNLGRNKELLPPTKP